MQFVVQFAGQCAVQCVRLEGVYLLEAGAPSPRFCCSGLVKKVSEGPEINLVTEQPMKLSQDKTRLEELISNILN